MRHTFASWYVMRTNDLAALREILGHCSFKLTLRYAHLSKGHMASNLAAFESAIPGEGGVIIPSGGPKMALA